MKNKKITILTQQGMEKRLNSYWIMLTNAFTNGEIRHLRIYCEKKEDYHVSTLFIPDLDRTITIAEKNAALMVQKWREHIEYFRKEDVELHQHINALFMPDFYYQEEEEKNK